jgi:hypothetical protein
MAIRPDNALAQLEPLHAASQAPEHLGDPVALLRAHGTHATDGGAVALWPGTAPAPHSRRRVASHHQEVRDP